MKRVIGNIYVLTIVLIFAACQSKTKNAVLYNCPVSIAMQLHEIDISLSEESLMKLNAFFIRNDSMAQVALSQGESLDNIAKWYYPAVDTLSSMLLPLERNDFILAAKGRSYIRDNKNYTTLLRQYILQRNVLHLSQRQIDLLLEQSDSIEACVVRKKDYVAFEVERKLLTSLLAEKQIKEFYVQKNQENATNETIKKWKQLKEHELYISADDSVKICKLLFDYILDQKVSWEYLRFIEANNDSIRQDEARLWAYRPFPMIQLEACGSSYNNRMLDIVCKREKIGLSEQTAKALLVSYSQLLQEEYKSKYDKKATDEKFDWWKKENRKICEIVPPKLLEEYFKTITQDYIKGQAQKSWEELIECGLVQTKDSAKVMNELVDYETRLEVASQWTRLDNSRKNEFTRADIINSKPQLLKRLDLEKEKKWKRQIVKF